MWQLSCTRLHYMYATCVVGNDCPASDFIRAANLSPQLADFSRMQPEQPSPWFIVAMIFVKMISTAGTKEAELQGASSVMRANAAVEAMQGET